MDSRAHQTSRLFHEAQRLAGKPRPVKVYQEADSLLLLAPNSIIFELFGTVLREPNHRQTVEHVHRHLFDYLSANWSSKPIKHAVARLKREQAIEARVAQLKEMPLLSASGGGRQQSPKSRSEPAAADDERPRTDRKQQAAAQRLTEQLLWRANTGNLSQVSALLFRLAIEDGYRSRRLQCAPFAEAPRCFRAWRQDLLIKLYAFGDAPADEQRLALASAASPCHEALARWVANYIDGSEKRQRPDLLRKLAGSLRDKTNNCIYLTDRLEDALTSLHSGVIRSALLVERNREYSDAAGALKASLRGRLERPLTEGKLFLVRGLDCVRFAPDPSADNCC